MAYLVILSHKYSRVFRENRCPPPPKPVYGGNFSHEAVTLKIRSRSPKSNKLLILSDLYRLANLVTFHLMVHEITQTNTFWLNFGGLSLTVTLKIRPRSPKPIQLFIMSKCYIHANLVKFHQFMRYYAHKHLLAQIWQFKSHSDLEKYVKVTSSSCPNVISMQIWLKSANQFMRYGKHKTRSQVLRYKSVNSSHAVRDLGRVRQYPPWLLLAAFVDSVGYPRYNPQKTCKQWHTRDRRFHWLWGWFPVLKIIFMM